MHEMCTWLKWLWNKDEVHVIMIWYMLDMCEYLIYTYEKKLVTLVMHSWYVCKALKMRYKNNA